MLPINALTNSIARLSARGEQKRKVTLQGKRQRMHTAPNMMYTALHR